MSDIRLFRVNGDTVTQLDGKSIALEKSLQTLIERHLEDFLGVRFLATEYHTNNGRMDTIGLDENNCPVIIEYKRASNENVITQGLFYLDWLMDHKADFKLLVLEKLGKEEADSIEWSMPRLLCIAGDFNKYDEHAINQMGRNIELIRYQHYGDLLLFETVASASTKVAVKTDSVEFTPTTPSDKKSIEKTVIEQLEQADQAIKDLYQSVEDYLSALGDDVQISVMKLYVAFRNTKNFACVQARRSVLTVYLRLDPDSVKLEDSFTRDVRNIGHWGTGDLQVTIKIQRGFHKSAAAF